MAASLPDSADAGMYGRSFADVYDDWYGDISDPSAVTAACAQRFPATARIVEFGSGSARLAAPLATHGFDVVGVDASRDMLRQSPMQANLESVASDMAQVGLTAACADGVIIAYNTLFNVADEARQQLCLAEAYRLLRPGGLLAIECFIAMPADGPSAALAIRSSTSDQTIAIVTERQRVAGRSQRIVGSHIELRRDDVICRPWELYYRPPGELDAAAATHGFGLTERFASWDGERFDPLGARHVSWYRRDGSDL